MNTNADLAVNEMLPVPKLAVLGLQHVLVMYAGAVAVPLIIGGALKLPKDQIAWLISADLFCCGIVTLIQCVGIWNIGIRLPVMMGVTFTAIPPIIATGATPGLGMPAVFGAVIASGLFTLVVAPYLSRLIRWFPPVVTGTVVLLVGVSLMKVGINWAAGGSPTLPSPNGPIPNPVYGAPINLAIAGSVLVSILLISALFKGFVANVAVLLGLCIGFVIAFGLGRVNFDGVANADWISVILPFHFGMPTFDLMSAVTLCLVMVVMMIESLGLFLAMGDITGLKIDATDMARGLRADGVGNIIGGIFGTFTYTSYSQNVGLVQVTGVKSRWVVAAAGAILIVLGCLPKLSYVVAAIPYAVIGGAGLVMFGMVASTGVKILGSVDFAGNRGNLYVVAVSLAFGMIPVVADQFFAQLPALADRLFHNGILTGTLCAVLLNALFQARQRPTSSLLTASLQRPAH
jgi:xanthine permease